MAKLLCAIIWALVLTFGYAAFALADSPGDLDITFNSTGIVTTSISSSFDIGDSVVVQADGKIVVAGTTTINSVDTFAVIRYDQNGSLDPSFNSTGVVTTSVGQNSGRQSIALQPDKKIVLAGSSYGVGFSRMTVVRYNPNGSLDTGFNGTGIVTPSIGMFSSGNAIAGMCQAL